MVIINTVKVDLIIKNNEEVLTYNNLNGIKNNNLLQINNNDDIYNINIDDIIKMNKENNESILDISFENNKVSKGTYFIKNLNHYFDIKIKTKEIKNIDNNIEIFYEQWIDEEYLGDYYFKVSIKE